MASRRCTSPCLPPTAAGIPAPRARPSPSRYPMDCWRVRGVATRRRSSRSTAGSSDPCSPWPCACAATARASEVLQDTMLKVLRGIGEYRASGPFWGWLRQIAGNEALLRLRRGKRLDQVLPLDGHDVEDTAAPPPAAADAATLQRALAALPDATRSVLWLYHAE